jgi:hypothetical protein
MAVAETVVAAILQRGRVFRGLFWTLAAHAAWLAVVFGLMAVRKPPMLLLVQTAIARRRRGDLGVAAAAQTRGYCPIIWLKITKPTTAAITPTKARMMASVRVRALLLRPRPARRRSWIVVGRVTGLKAAGLGPPSGTPCR